jgi:predicted transcriptional regulator
MEQVERDELVGTLRRRRSVLEAIDEQPRQKPALAEELAVARSTIDRAIRTLTTEGLVERGDDGYVLTTTGELSLDAFTSFADELAAIRSADDVLSKIPGRGYVDSAILQDAEIVRGSVSAPDRPVKSFVESIEDAVFARGVSPTAYESYVDVFTSRVIDDGMEAEFVFSDGALTEITANHPEALQETIETGRVDVYRVDELPEVGLIVLELEDGSEMTMLGTHEVNHLGAVVKNYTPEAVEWANGVIDEHFERAEQIPL